MICSEEEGLPIEYKSEVIAYSNLHNFFYEEYGLILLNSEMNDIIKAVDNFKKEFKNNNPTMPL
jgi:ribosomal protein L10